MLAKTKNRAVSALRSLRSRGVSFEEILEAWDMAEAPIPLVVGNTAPNHGEGVYPGILWASGTSNRKTGDIPTAWIGETREISYASCNGCPLRERDCYAHNGTPAMGHASMIKSYQKNEDKTRYDLDTALNSRSVTARYVRMSAIGDAARANPVEVRNAEATTRANGLGWLSYTHFWEEVAERGDQHLFTASTGSLEEADTALAAGYSRVTVVLPWDAFASGKNTFTTPNGEKGVICPAMSAHAKGTRVTCNQCGLCDPKAKGPKVIGFPGHGPGVKAKVKKLAAVGVSWAKNLLVSL